MKLEDHRLVEKAIQPGAWGQVGTIYEVTNEMADEHRRCSHRKNLAMLSMTGRRAILFPSFVWFCL